jgi:uncharacterized membrane protein
VSELIVIGYPDRETAGRVLDELQGLEKKELIDLDDAALIVRNEKGKFRVTTTDHVVAQTTLGGMFWGTLIGFLFLAPVAGMAIGGAIGAAAGGLGEMGIKDDFKSRVLEVVQPGNSAILAIIRHSTPARVLETLQPFGGTVLQTSLTHEAEEKLVKALQGERSAGD